MSRNLTEHGTKNNLYFSDFLRVCICIIERERVPRSCVPSRGRVIPRGVGQCPSFKFFFKPTHLVVNNTNTDNKHCWMK